MLKKLSLVVVAIALILGLTAITAKADIIAEPVVYEIEGQPYEGYFAINRGFGENQPVVVLIHDWNGIDDYEKRRTQMLAEQGYAAFAVDLYGQGVRPANPEESQEESGKLYADRATFRERLFAGLGEARQMAGVDPDRVVAMGYCFGGAAVLELARAGADLEGFVSFHGGLTTPEGQDYSQAQGPILILHGGNDPVAPMSDVAVLASELNAAGVAYDMEIYGDVLHSFTVWGADRETARYNAKADIQSWEALMTFLAKQLR